MLHFLISALDGDDGLTSHLRHLTPSKRIPRLNLNAFIEEKSLLPMPGIESLLVHDAAYSLFTILIRLSC